MQVDFLSSNHSCFQYGEGFFETMGCFDGKVPLLEMHLERLSAALNEVGEKLPEKLHALLAQYIKENKLKNAKIKLQCTFEPSEGLKRSRNLQFLFHSVPLRALYYAQNKPVRLLVLKEFQLTAHPLSAYKTCSYFIHTECYRRASFRQMDDGILCHQNYISETSHSNIFILYKNQWLTPSLNNGCVGGVARKSVLQFMRENNIPAKEDNIPIDWLYEADQVMLSNAVKGLVPVAQIEDKMYDFDTVQDIQKAWRLYLQKKQH